jgi:hypothetical protein
MVDTPQTTLKTASGATKHSDFEPPYSSFEFDDWSFGRGYPDHHKQANAYLDAKSMYTAKPDYIFPAGKVETADLPIDYIKLDWRWNGSKEVIGWQHFTNNGPATPYGYGYYFNTPSLIQNCQMLHVTLGIYGSHFGLFLDDIKVRIYEAIPDAGQGANCKIPDNANMVIELNMDVGDREFPEYEVWTEEEYTFTKKVAGVIQEWDFAAGQDYFIVFWIDGQHFPYPPYWQTLFNYYGSIYYDASGVSGYPANSHSVTTVDAGSNWVVDSP